MDRPGFPQVSLNGVLNLFHAVGQELTARTRGGFRYLPQVNTKPAYAPNRTRQATPSQREVSISLEAGYLPILLGRRRIQPFSVPISLQVVNGEFHGIWLFGKGEWDYCESITLNGAAPATFGATAVTYRGTDDQAEYPGDVYVYVTWAPAAIPDLPRIDAIWRGRRMYDPRTAETIYSSNPAIELAHVMTDMADGQRIDTNLINWDTVADAADWCDDLLGEAPNQQKRFEGHFYFKGGSLTDTLNMIKLHGLLEIGIDADGKYRIDAKKPRNVVAAFSEAEIWDCQTPDVTPALNVINYTYTNPATWEAEAADPLEDPGLGVNDEIHEGNYDLTGHTFLSQAKRVATFLINDRLSDLPCTFKTLDYKGLQKGDVFTLTSRLGFTDKQFELLACDRIDKAWQISCREYDPAMFSDTIVTEPTYDDTTLPGPDAVPTEAADLYLTEILEQLPDTTWLDSIEIQFGFSAFPWVSAQAGYEIYVKQGDGDYILAAILPKNANLYKLRAVQADQTYTIKIVVVSTFGPKSDGITETITPTGKTAKPVWKEGATLNGVEAGDIVWLYWWMAGFVAPAIDTDAIYYNLYRGAPGQSLEEMTHIARSPMLTYQDTNPPSGDIAYRLTAEDPRNTTETSLYKEVTVTKNAYRAVAADHYASFVGGALTSAQVMEDGTIVPVDASYDTLGERFPGTALGDGVGGTYNYFPLPAPASATATSAVKDMGAILEGSFSLVDEVTKLGAGTASVTKELMLSVDDVDYDTYSAATAFEGRARYYKIKYTFSSSSLDTTNIVSAGYHVHVEMKPKKENGVAVVDSSGSYTVTFVESFVSIDEWPTPSVDYEGDGLDPRIAVWENPSETGGTLKVFDKNNAARGGTVRWNVAGR